MPEFFWAIVVILVFAAWLGWLPASGYEPLSAGFWVWAQHLIAPTMTLVFGHLAHVSRLTRSSMIEVMQSPYVTAARAKGLPERVVVIRHALRNALLPTITVLALDFGRLMGGIVVVETVFAYPGLGRLLVFSIQNRDLPTLQAAILVVAAIYALANLAGGSPLRLAEPEDPVWPQCRLTDSPSRRVETDAGAAPRRSRCSSRPGSSSPAAIVLLGLLAPWIAPASLGHDLDAHALLAAERDLLARHRRVRARRAEPAADGHAPLACHGRERDAGQPRHRRADRACGRLFPRLDRRGR